MNNFAFFLPLSVTFYLLGLFLWAMQLKYGTEREASRFFAGFAAVVVGGVTLWVALS